MYGTIMKKPFYTLAILDDHPVMHIAIKNLLKKQDKIRFVKFFSSESDFISFVEQSPVDMVILDITLNSMNGIEILQLLKKKYSQMKIVIFTMHESPFYFSQAVNSGADGYILKTDNITVLPEVLGKIADGEKYYSSSLKQFSEQSQEKLTKRESEILNLICSGMSVSEISEKLSLSKRTVEYHTASLRQKFKVHSLLDLIQKVKA